MVYDLLYFNGVVGLALHVENMLVLAVVASTSAVFWRLCKWNFEINIYWLSTI